ncbi:hypothetical protein B0H19DRAFT_1085560 [Mycena capillaripes]|nr:hypothetical protein B0H19DRAFT_1085560 [Mycena capillaripes]
MTILDNRSIRILRISEKGGGIVKAERWGAIEGMRRSERGTKGPCPLAAARTKTCGAGPPAPPCKESVGWGRGAGVSESGGRAAAPSTEGWDEEGSEREWEGRKQEEKSGVKENALSTSTPKRHSVYDTSVTDTNWAENESRVCFGEERPYATQSVPSGRLPDGRNIHQKIMRSTTQTWSSLAIEGPQPIYTPAASRHHHPSSKPSVLVIERRTSNSNTRHQGSSSARKLHGRPRVQTNQIPETPSQMNPEESG